MIRRAGLVLAVLALVAAACASASETVVEQIIEGDDGVTDVDIKGDEVTIEFDDEEGGGNIVIGGGEVPDGLGIDVPDGGEIWSSIEQTGMTAVSLIYPIDEFDALVDFYTDWMSDQGAENVSNSSTTNPRSESWFGETADGQFGIALFEGTDNAGNPAVNVSLNRTTATP